MNEALKNTVYASIDVHREEILRFGREILHHPELGYKETQTSAAVRRAFDALHIPYTYPHALTGVKGRLAGGAHRANVCLIAELDAVKSPGHPCADPLTGAAHACGHNAQAAMLLGAAYGLQAVMQQLDGDVTLFAVPAEEFAELEFREGLRRQGRICAFGGKQQLIAEGAFDDVDMAMMIHSRAGLPAARVQIGGSSLGFVAKMVTMRGRSAHGAAPFDGVNALNAMLLALMGIHANRETFRDEDQIRIHPIITKGGDLVNVVPAEATMETYVRGARLPAISDAAQKVDRCMRGAALMIGADAAITDFVGYLPLLQSDGLNRAFAHNAETLLGSDAIDYNINMTGSTDIGDLSHLIPVIQPTMGGFSGTAHGADFAITDENTAYLLPAKLLAATVVDLLADQAKLACRIRSGFCPQLTKDAYLRYVCADRPH